MSSLTISPSIKSRQTGIVFIHCFMCTTSLECAEQNRVLTGGPNEWTNEHALKQPWMNRNDHINNFFRLFVNHCGRMNHRNLVLAIFHPWPGSETRLMIMLMKPMIMLPIWSITHIVLSGLSVRNPEIIRTGNCEWRWSLWTGSLFFCSVFMMLIRKSLPIGYLNRTNRRSKTGWKSFRAYDSLLCR